MAKARALFRGYYPIAPGGPCDIVEPGQVFDLVEGHEKGKWFEVLPETAKPAKAKPAKADDPKPGGDLA